MATKFRIGDRVRWSFQAGRVSGHIVRVHTRNVAYKGYTRHASEEEPQYEIRSDKTDYCPEQRAGIATSAPLIA